MEREEVKEMLIFSDKNIAAVSLVLNVIHDRVCVISIQTEGHEHIVIISAYFPFVRIIDDYECCFDEVSKMIYLLRTAFLWNPVK